jgi:PAS domain-containing protein
VPIAAYILGIYITKFITGPLHRLHKVTEIIGAGNLDYRTGIDTKDEVGQLSRAFDAMTEKLKETMTSIDILNKEVTGRKNAEEALVSSEKKFRTIFESSRDAIMTLEPPSWLFTSANQATVEMFKAKDEADFTFHEPWSLSPGQQPDGRASAEKAKEMIEIAMRDGSNFFEWTHKRLNGEEFPATVLLAKMVLAGKTILQATVRDITEYKKIEKVDRKHTQELEIFYKASVGREERIIELKKEVEMLKKELEK